jgi:hypothetical protein
VKRKKYTVHNAPFTSEEVNILIGFSLGKLLAKAQARLKAIDAAMGHYTGGSPNELCVARVEVAKKIKRLKRQKKELLDSVK